jgi:hypothetical protein
LAGKAAHLTPGGDTNRKLNDSKLAFTTETQRARRGPGGLITLGRCPPHVGLDFSARAVRVCRAFSAGIVETIAAYQQAARLARALQQAVNFCGGRAAAP